MFFLTRRGAGARWAQWGLEKPVTLELRNKFEAKQSAEEYELVLRCQVEKWEAHVAGKVEVRLLEEEI